MRKPFSRLVFRWFVNSLGLWVAATLFDKIEYNDRLATIIIAGLLLSLMNALLKPLIVILSLPAILLSLGLFMVVINGLMVALLSTVYPAFQVNSFLSAMLAGIVIGLVNYVVTVIIEDKKYV